MTSGLFKNAMNNICLQIIYILIYMYMHKTDLALTNQQWLICHETKPNQTNQYWVWALLGALYLWPYQKSVDF